MLFASQNLFEEWALMSGNKEPRNTGERKNFIEANISIDSTIWAAVKNNKKFVALCLLFGLNFVGNVSIRDLTVMNRKEIAGLQDKVKDYEALQSKVSMCEKTQERQLLLLPLVEQLTNLLKNNRPTFRNPQARREFDEVTTRILQIKPISQGESVAGSSMFGGAR